MFDNPSCPMCGSMRVSEEIVAETSVVEFYDKHVEFSYEAPIFCCNSEGCHYAWPDERYHNAKEEARREICGVVDTEKYNNAKLEIDGMNFGD